MSNQALAASNQIYTAFEANSRSVDRTNGQGDLSPRDAVLAALVEAILEWPDGPSSTDIEDISFTAHANTGPHLHN